MQTVKVRASTEYDVLIERGILKRAGELIKKYTGAGRALLITDRTVDGLYSKAALESLKSAGINCEKFVFEDGEEHKSLKTVGDILSFAAQLSLNRSDSSGRRNSRRCNRFCGERVSARCQIRPDTDNAFGGGRFLSRRQNGSQSPRGQEPRRGVSSAVARFVRPRLLRHAERFALCRRRGGEHKIRHNLRRKSF